MRARHLEASAGPLWTFQEPEIERHEYEDDTEIRRQAWPELISEEQEINGQDGDDQQQYVQDGDRLACHFSGRFEFGCTPHEGRSRRQRQPARS
jgi:hypothetical protein